MNADTQLTSRTVLVTGAARGIGKAIAAAFAGCAAKVGLSDILAQELESTAQELTEAGADVLPVTADVTDVESVEAMVAQVEHELGPIDILVSNAGTFSYIGPVWEADPQKWFHDVRVNLYGSFLCCRAVVGRMVERGGGYVITIATTGGLNDPHPYSTSYACSKTALVRLTEALAKEAGPHGVKTFSVGPPAILTEMTRFIMSDPSARKWRPGFERIFQEGRGHPPELVADLCVKLVSGRADRLTGRYFKATRDFDETIARADDIIDRDLLTVRLPAL
ncbi:MAG: SDR family NAD(P)-dependent oxidoreductase [Armatimonadota bacterium]